MIVKIYKNYILKKKQDQPNSTSVAAFSSCIRPSVLNRTVLKHETFH